MSITSDRINKLGQLIKAENYLEIGVYKGTTFNEINIKNKYAVDPKFAFNYKIYNKGDSHFFEMTSDEFFNYLQKNNPDLKFDLIFLDGLHTFQQTYKDFIQSIAYSHDKTIWILDDVLPQDPFSAIPDYDLAKKYKKLYKFKNYAVWMGDVYKILFALYYFHDNFSYATVMTDGNPQTIVWKTPSPACRNLKKSSPTLQDIAAIDFFVLMENLRVYNPIKPDEIESRLYTNIASTDGAEVIEAYLAGLNKANF